MAAQNTRIRTSLQRSEGRLWGRPVARRYELRPGGLLYIAITLFVAIGAFNSQNNLLFWLFGMAVGAIIISGIASGAAMMGLRGRRLAPPVVEAGARAPLTYELRHRGRFIPAFALLIRELPGASLPEGRVGVLEPALAHIDHLSPGSRGSGHCWAMAGRRGLVRLERFEVSTVFPFGLFRKSLIFEQPAEISVTPVRLTLRDRLLETIAAGSDQGALRTSQTGISDEFFGLRAYMPGDSPRTIAWRRSAAIGELVVRQFSAPMPPRVILELHPGLGESSEQTREVAIAMLATLSADASASGYSVGIDASWAGYRSPLGGGVRLTRRRLRELSSLELVAKPGARAQAPLSRGAGRTILSDGAAGDGRAEHPVIDVSDETSWLLPGAALPRVLGPAETPKQRGRTRAGRPRNVRAAVGS